MINQDELTQCITNKTYDEIKVGDHASITRMLTRQDIQLFAVVTGDLNPAHLDEAYARTDIFHQIIGHGMWTGSMFSALLGMYLPGPGTIYLSQTLKFLKPVHIGEQVKASVTVIAKDDAKKHITFETLCTNGKGEHVLEGEALVLAPKEKISWRTQPLPEVQMKNAGHNYQQWLMDQVKPMKPIKTAVVHPLDEISLRGAFDAVQAGVIEPVLVGNEEKIKHLAKELHLDISGYTLVTAQHSHEAAAIASQMAGRGEVEAIMKGKLHTDELLEAILKPEHGLRTGKRMSHVFVLDVPSYPKPLFLTDAAINLFPKLLEKRDIVQNAVDLFAVLGLGIPKVAILSAVETVSEKLPSTLDATALCKMAERGQITGAIIDGPLAFDNAISRESALIKGIRSEVAGDADILVVPDLESGNMLYKQLRYFSGAQGAGIVLGARVPIILTSRAGDAENRVISAALTQLYVRRNSK